MRLIRLLVTVMIVFSASLWASEEGLTTDIIIEQIGKFHPLVLHFPAVFIPLTLITMLVGNYIPGQEFWRKTVPYFLHGSTIMALAASALGLLLTANMNSLEGTLYYHRLFALILCGWLIIVSLVCLKLKPNFEQKVPVLFIVLAFISANLLGIAAHFGGITTHGELLIIFEYL